MKQIIFALCLIIAAVMIVISIAYANATMLVGAVLCFASILVLLWDETKRLTENKTKMKF
jgi:hypothetical protein